MPSACSCQPMVKPIHLRARTQRLPRLAARVHKRKKKMMLSDGGNRFFCLVANYEGNAPRQPRFLLRSHKVDRVGYNSVLPFLPATQRACSVPFQPRRRALARLHRSGGHHRGDTQSARPQAKPPLTGVG